MTAEAHQRKNTLRRFTNGDIFLTFDQQWAISPRGISCYPVPGFTPSMARFVHDNTTFQEVCRVFVLQCRSTSYIQIYTIIQVTFMHPYINTFICSYIHTFMRTQHMHNISLHMVAIVTQSLRRLHPFVSILTYHVSSGQS